MNVATLSFDDALVDQLADRVLERAVEKLAEQANTPAEDGWLRGAERIAAYIDAKPSRIYAWRQTGLPVQKDGSQLCARKSELDAWMRAGGGKRL